MILEGNIVFIILDAWSQIRWPLLIEHGEKKDGGMGIWWNKKALFFIPKVSDCPVWYS